MESFEKDLLDSQVKRIVTALFKDFLTILFELQQENLSNIAKLSRQFPAEFVDKINMLDFAKYSRLRKHILDKSNDSLREISTLLDNFNISLYHEDRNKE
jgi:hypothetical protein